MYVCVYIYTPIYTPVICCDVVTRLLNLGETFE